MVPGGQLGGGGLQQRGGDTAQYAAVVGNQGQVNVGGGGVRDRSSSKLKAVSGTFSGSIERGARKMKVAPVDIFVYGVHKETTVEDIVEELEYSDIAIAKEDIEEKTREGSNVKSFKIAIKAEFLEKALKPEMWPLRAKVREWVYFPRRRDQQPEGGRMGQRGTRAHGRDDRVTGAGGTASLYKHTTPEGTPASGDVINKD